MMTPILKNGNLKNRSFLKLLDFSAEEINYLLDLSSELKRMKKTGREHKFCNGKNMVLLFEKTSTRTRCAFEVSGYDLGMNVTYLDPASSQMGRKESLEDTAKVLGRMYDAIEYRGFGQEIVENLAKYSGVPVFNGLTNEFHPTQVLADLLTIKERFGELKGRKLVFFGDARYNMGNSLMVGCCKMGMDFAVCSSPEYYPSRELVDTCREIAGKSGSKLVFSSDCKECASGADAVYTDVWVSMGESESVWQKRINDLQKFRVTPDVMDCAGGDAIFMHCLPSFHDLETEIGRSIYEKYGISEMEVSDSVFRSSSSVVFDEAENRLHTIKAVIAASLGE